LEVGELGVLGADGLMMMMMINSACGIQDPVDTPNKAGVGGEEVTVNAITSRYKFKLMLAIS
jgi:hypothetical protein